MGRAITIVCNKRGYTYSFIVHRNAIAIGDNSRHDRFTGNIVNTEAGSFTRCRNNHQAVALFNNLNSGSRTGRLDTSTMYHELSPETAEFIDFMQDNELFDVESRPGKMSGGYMTSLPSYKAPFIFANWNNTSGDVDVLTHECGHAFEGYVAERDPNVPADLECPAMESAEIHSMAMEFLTAPWHHLLFGKDTEKYALLHAEDSFVFLAYGCAVDEFQHIMYQNPDLTPDQRNAEWLKLEKKYRPWIDFDNLPFYGRGAGWQRQLHIYECPFYYIDYCLSTMAALQFFLLSLDDHKDAWQRYLKLVRRAGLASYTELLQTAGLKVPFAEGSVKGIAQQMTRWLEEHQVD